MLPLMTQVTVGVNQEGCVSTYWLVNITNDRTSDDEESRALESSQDPKDEKGCQVGRQSGSNREGSEQRCAYD